MSTSDHAKEAKKSNNMRLREYFKVKSEDVISVKVRYTCLSDKKINPTQKTQIRNEFVFMNDTIFNSCCQIAFSKVDIKIDYIIPYANDTSVYRSGRKKSREEFFLEFCRTCRSVVLDPLVAHLNTIEGITLTVNPDYHYCSYINASTPNKNAPLLGYINNRDRDLQLDHQLRVSSVLQDYVSTQTDPSRRVVDIMYLLHDLYRHCDEDDLVFAMKRLLCLTYGRVTYPLARVHTGRTFEKDEIFKVERPLSSSYLRPIHSFLHRRLSLLERISDNQDVTSQKVKIDINVRPLPQEKQNDINVYPTGYYQHDFRQTKQGRKQFKETLKRLDQFVSFIVGGDQMRRTHTFTQLPRVISFETLEKDE